MRILLNAAVALCCLMISARADEQSPEQASIAFVRTYFQLWSSSNASALGYMNGVFPDKITYFDRTLDHAALMKIKSHFAERWPERNFQARPDSLKVTCNQQNLCTVWGLVDWTCRSDQRHEAASGTSVFSFQLQDDAEVVAEDGFVVSRGHPLETQLPHAVTTAPAPAPQGSNPANGPAQASHDAKAGNYTNNDIPRLRASYFALSSDHDWIKDWLMAEKKFDGTARSEGEAGVQTLSDLNGDTLHVMRFDSQQGPIACMIQDIVPPIPQGSDVRIAGTVSIFIDQTMYLTHCSFG